MQHSTTHALLLRRLVARGCSFRQSAPCYGWGRVTTTVVRNSSSGRAPEGQQQQQRGDDAEAPESGATSTSSSSGGGGSGSGRGAVGENLCTVTYRGVAFQVPRGTTLRTAMLRNGVTPHNGRAQLINCRGLGTCGTCAVEVVGGPVSPSEWTTAESLRLNFPPHGPPGNERLRLACQVGCEGDAEVVKRSRFWGQGSDVLPPLSESSGCGSGSAGQAGGSDGVNRGGSNRGGSGGDSAQQRARAPLGELEYILDRRSPRK